MKTLLSMKLGATGSLSLMAGEGKIVGELSYDFGGAKVSADLEVSEEAGIDVLLAKVKALIPGSVDDMVIDGLNALLKKFLAA